MFSDFSILFVVIVIVKYNRHGTNSWCGRNFSLPGECFVSFDSLCFMRFKFRLQFCCMIQISRAGIEVVFCVGPV